MPRMPNPDEAAAIAAAIDRFQADTAPAGAGAAPGPVPWQRAALLEGIGAKRTIAGPQGQGGEKWLS